MTWVGIRTWWVLAAVLMTALPARAYAMSGGVTSTLRDAVESVSRADAGSVGGASGGEKFGAQGVQGVWRWLSPDPLFDPLRRGPVSYNPYQYGRWSPVRFVDPDGRDEAEHESGWGVSYAIKFWSDKFGNHANAQRKRFAEDRQGFVKRNSAFAGIDGASEGQELAVSPEKQGEAVGESARGWSKALMEGAEGAASVMVPESVLGRLKLAKQLASEAAGAELVSGGGRIMAGAGTKTAIKDVARLVAEHGGEASDWAKVTSTTSQVMADGTAIEVHAYKNVTTGVVVELKSKVIGP